MHGWLCLFADAQIPGKGGCICLQFAPGHINAVNATISLYCNNSVLYKHSAKWNLIAGCVGRLAGLVEEGPAPSKKIKTGQASKSSPIITGHW